MTITLDTRETISRALAKFLAYAAMGDEERMMEWADTLRDSITEIEDRALTDNTEATV